MEKSFADRKPPVESEEITITLPPPLPKPSVYKITMKSKVTFTDPILVITSWLGRLECCSAAMCTTMNASRGI
jgi:hypothetical protein